MFEKFFSLTRPTVLTELCSLSVGFLPSVCVFIWRFKFQNRFKPRLVLVGPFLMFVKKLTVPAGARRVWCTQHSEGPRRAAFLCLSL